MDPTKNFDHLDPKLKETYARVMGTTPAGTADATQNTAPTVDPGLSATPTATPPADVTGQPQSQFIAAPLDQPMSSFPNQNMGPNPGTGPTINSIPTDTTTMIAPPIQPAPVQPSADVNAALPNSSFFSNPSPAMTDPAQNPGPTGGDTNLSASFSPVTEPASAPVTPYSPDSPSQYVPPAEVNQPLPSPSSVAQKGPRETSALLRVLYIIAAVIFFAIYTVFWIKVFNLPFLF